MRELQVAGNCEIREDSGKSKLIVTALQEGRIASGLKELFAPGSMQWGSDGIAIRLGHGNREELRSMPVRLPDGRIQVSSENPTSEIIQALAAGVRGASIEFYSLKEKRNGSGVREINSAFLEAVAIVKAPEYSQGKAELRNRQGRRRIWL